MILSSLDFIQWQSKFVDPRHKVYTFKHILVHDFSHQGNKNCLQSKLARDRREDDGFVVCLMFPESTEAQGSSRNFRPHYCLFMRHFGSFTFKTHHSWKGRKGPRILSTSAYCQPFNSNNEPVQLVPWNHQSRLPHWLWEIHTGCLLWCVTKARTGLGKVLGTWQEWLHMNWLIMKG